MKKGSAPAATNILLVEDDEHDRVAFCRTLKKSEICCDITECEKAEEALELLRSDSRAFDLMVVDYGLPGMSGLEFFKRIHGAGDLPPCVMLTGRGSEHVAVEALKAGVADYVVKDPAHSYLQLLPLVISEALRRNEEKLTRLKMEKALSENERLLRMVIESMPMGVWLRNAEGRIIMENSAGKEIWGGACYVGAEQFRERKAWRLATGKRIKAGKWALSRAMRSGKAILDEEILIESFDGERKIVLNSALPVRSSDGRVVAGVAIQQDITERKRAEKLSWALNTIDKIIYSTLDLDEIMQRAVTEAAKALECETAAISLRNEGAWIVSHVHGFSKEIIGAQMNDDEEPHALLAIREQKVVVISDTLNDERVNRRHMQKWNIRSVMVAPLLVKGEAIGALFFNSYKTPFSFLKAHEDFASKLAASLSLALENARLFKDLETDIAERKRLEEELWQANEQLEARVADRTRKLTEAVQALEVEIAERQTVEDALRVSEQKLRFLFRRLLSAQEDERKRLARELHDSIGSSLSGIKYGLENLFERLEPNADEAASTESLIHAIRETIEEARRLMSDLRPAMLDDLGLQATVSWLCRRFHSFYPHILIEQQVDFFEEEIPEHLKIVMFRVMQEALNNIAKYSEAESATVSLVGRDGAIELIIADNGKGFDVEGALAVEESGRGLGLTSMRERAELSGGAFLLESAIGEGTRLKVCWKVGRQTAALLDDAGSHPNASDAAKGSQSGATAGTALNR